MGVSALKDRPVYFAEVSTISHLKALSNGKQKLTCCFVLSLQTQSTNSDMIPRLLASSLIFMTNSGERRRVLSPRSWCCLQGPNTVSDQTEAETWGTSLGSVHPGGSAASPWVDTFRLWGSFPWIWSNRVDLSVCFGEMASSQQQQRKKKAVHGLEDQKRVSSWLRASIWMCVQTWWRALWVVDGESCVPGICMFSDICGSLNGSGELWKKQWDCGCCRSFLKLLLKIFCKTLMKVVQVNHKSQVGQSKALLLKTLAQRECVYVHLRDGWWAEEDELKLLPLSDSTYPCFTLPPFSL